MLDHQANGQGFDPSIGATPPHEQWQGAIRELPPAQLYHVQWHLLRLEDGSRRSRFAAPTSDAFQKEYGGRADGTATVVFGCFVNGQLRGAVEMRLLQSDGCRTAEIVFSVERAWQGRGIGTALMVAAVRAARDRGIDHLYLRCHALNRRMQHIAERFAAKVAFEDCECFADIAVRMEPTAPALRESGSSDEPPNKTIVLDL